MTDIYESTLKTLKIREHQLELELRKVKQCIAVLTTNSPKRVHSKNISKNCVVCDTAFLAGRKDAKYCTIECARAANEGKIPERQAAVAESHKREQKGVTLVQGAQK